MRVRASLWFVPLLVCAMALWVPSGAGVGAQRPEQSAPSDAVLPAPSIHLQAATFAPALGEAPDLPAEFSGDGATLSAIDVTGQALVQYQGPILSTWRDALEATGATIVGYVPDFAYQVALDPALDYAAWAETTAFLEGVIWVGPYQPGYRVSPDALGADGSCCGWTWRAMPQPSPADSMRWAWSS